MPELIAPNLYQLDIPLVGSPLKNLNSYLIVGRRNLLIDTGYREDPCREAMQRQLAEMHVDLEKTDIFLTHRHSDHTGLSTELHREGCQIYISHIDAEGLTTYGTDDFWRIRFAHSVADGFSLSEMEDLWGTNPARTNAPQRFEGYTRLQDGDTLSYGGYELTAILTPGHTPGHMCLYAPAQQLLFSGDHVLFHISPNICRWEEMPDALGSYLESLEKIKHLPVRTLLPAHRHETGALLPRVEELQAHHARRIADTLHLVQERPGLNTYEIAGLMRWKIRSRSWEEFPLTQKFFAVGEARAHLDYLAARGQTALVERGGKNCWFAKAR